MISDLTLQSAIDQQASTAQANTTLAQDFQQFLTLLTVQLQNQDPLSPMDSTEFTNQLVSFTQVEQQISANQKMDDLIALGLNESMSNAQSYVGKTVSYIGAELYFDGAPQTITYSLPTTASSATFRVYDATGALVHEESASKESGAHDMIWSGKTAEGSSLPTGTYAIEIDALDPNGTPIEATTVVNGLVNGIESQNGQIFLLVGERAVSTGNILNTQLPPNAHTTPITNALNYIGLEVTYTAATDTAEDEDNTQDTPGNGADPTTGIVTGIQSDNGTIVLEIDKTTLVPLSDIDAVSTPPTHAT